MEVEDDLENIELHGESSVSTEEGVHSEPVVLSVTSVLIVPDLEDAHLFLDHHQRSNIFPTPQLLLHPELDCILAFYIARLTGNRLACSVSSSRDFQSNPLRISETGCAFSMLARLS